MSIKKIILLFSDGKNNEKILHRYFSYDNIYWTYFGPNYPNFKRIDAYIGNHFKYIEISRKLDDISGKIRDDYQHYIDDLNTANKDTFQWWFTPISSRNPGKSSVFQNLCFLELVKEIVSEISPTEIFVIVAENYSIGHAIEANADALGAEVVTLGKNKRSFHCRIASIIRRIIRCIAKAGFNHASAILTAIRSENKPAKRYSKISGKTCMIDVFVYENNFTDNGGFTDRYFPGLEPFLIKNGYNVVYYPTFTGTNLNKYSRYRKARANKRVFLIEQDFLHIRDYFSAMKSAIISVRFKVKGPLFYGFDIGKIDEGDFKWNSLENIFKAYLQYFAFVRMSETLGDKFERIISWHENQLQDKALCKAVHETFKGCKIVGSHPYIHYSNWLNPIPLNSETVNVYTPDVFLTLGDSEAQKIKRQLSKKECYCSASLRYYKLFNRSKYIIKTTNNNMKNILVLFPYSRIETQYLMSKITEIDSVYGNKCNYILKCHPDYDITTLKSIYNFSSINARIQFTEKDIYSISSSTCINAVISMSSSVIVESASLGIPTIVMFNPNTLTDDPFEGESWINVIKCYNNSDLMSALDKFFSIDYSIAKTYRKEGENIRNSHFSISKSNDLSDYIN